MSRTVSSARHHKLVKLIIEERRSAGLTQPEVAKKLQRSQSIVATMESGQRRIDVVEFLELAEVIGFDARKMIARLQRI